MATLLKSIGKQVVPTIGAVHLIFLLGIALRLALAPYTFQGDIITWHNSITHMLAGLDPYEGIGFTYPPLWLYLLAPIFTLASFLADPANYAVTVDRLEPLRNIIGYNFSPITSPLFNLLFKLPLIVGDVLLGILLYRLVRPIGGEGKARWALALWLLNPVVIFQTAIHGQFDAWPALLVFIALLSLVAGRYGQAGLALSTGMWFKLYPAALLPLYLAVIASRSLSSNTGQPLLARARGLGKDWLRFGAGIAVPFALFVGPLVGSRFLEAAFGVRLTSDGLAVHFGDPRALGGGLNFWALRDQPPLDQFIRDHAQAIGRATDVILPLAVAAIALTTARMYRRRPLAALLYGHAVTVAALLLTARVVNPQYILWILPFLIVMFAMSGRLRELAGIALLSLAGLLYSFFLLDTVTGFLLPLAVWHPVGGVSVDSIYRDLVDLPQASKAPLVAVGLATTAALLHVFFCPPQPRPEATPEQPPPETASQRLSPARRVRQFFRAIRPTPPTAPVGLSLLLLSLVSLLLVGQAAYYANAVIWQRGKAEAEGALLMRQSSDYRASIWYRVASGSFPLRGRVIAAPLKEERALQPNVHVYLDEAYPTLGTRWARVRGLYRHLKAQLGMRDYSGQVRLVDAPGLPGLLAAEPNAVVVMAASVIPDTVLDQQGHLAPLRSWLERGGTLIWVGHALGYYVGHSGQPPQREAIGERGWQELVGPKMYRQDKARLRETIGQEASPLAQALGLRFRIARWSFPLADLEAASGQALGWLRPHRKDPQKLMSSIFDIPVGKGHIIAFGWSLGTDEPDVARDVASILLSGYLAVDSQQLAHQEFQAGRQEMALGTISLTVPADSEAVVVTFFSLDPYSRFYQQEVVRIGPWRKMRWEP